MEFLLGFRFQSKSQSRILGALDYCVVSKEFKVRAGVFEFFFLGVLARSNEEPEYLQPNGLLTCEFRLENGHLAIQSDQTAEDLQKAFPYSRNRC